MIVTVARKPLSPNLTITEQVLTTGTGAINIDASRSPAEPTQRAGTIRPTSVAGDTRIASAAGIYGARSLQPAWESHPLGRYPSNLWRPIG